MKPVTFNYADHLRLQAEMEKQNEYTNALKAENKRLKALYIDQLKRSDDDICSVCENLIECKGEKCDCYEIIKNAALDREVRLDWKWTCEDFHYGSCAKMRGTPCDGCFDGDFSGFVWNGKGVKHD